MKITVGQLRELFRQGLATEAKVGAHPDYMKKERVREKLQQIVAELVASGEVKDEKDLEETFGAADMSLKALKMIPLDVWKKIAAQK